MSDRKSRGKRSLISISMSPCSLTEGFTWEAAPAGCSLLAKDFTSPIALLSSIMFSVGLDADSFWPLLIGRLGVSLSGKTVPLSSMF
nr:hypothetical protein Itr_chr06CG17500 [Ipomoea trifida]